MPTLHLYLADATNLADARYAGALGFALVGFAMSGPADAPTQALMRDVAPWMSGPGLCARIAHEVANPAAATNGTMTNGTMTNGTMTNGASTNGASTNGASTNGATNTPAATAAEWDALAQALGVQALHLPAGHPAAATLQTPFVQDAPLDGSPASPRARAVLVPFVPDLNDLAALCAPAHAAHQEVWLDFATPAEADVPPAERLAEALQAARATGAAMRPPPPQSLGLNDFSAIDLLLERLLGDA